MMWSKLRKEIRELITSELRQRIDIHCTCYHDAHDNYGEVWITLDGKKLFGGGHYYWYRIFQSSQEILSYDFALQHGGHQEFSKPKVESREVETLMRLGFNETGQITNSLENYINTPYEESLNSNNPIYKAFALVDKRLGKRRFLRIDITNEKHPLVKLFYKLRKECFK
ncbi:SF0329 family protein [Clostridium beijerinckii]|uniref:Uncharacterized protein n=1 Tax=Clostridium beijerinckii TaxID=1520 RepID=A0AAX0AVP6_CLOBE|nr:hypothetical protein [Clostridium beijerinckii]MBA8934313.1 hypothetical protein [Clostridium beijerinckii]NRT86832.1 hypothetical protein [Clostridium beijerinckii]NRU38504.1 hypothetical protein [Clostridium beijerinckii]NSA98217.1 hypothetical protein [Clostridium beijerinckii]NYC72264.1 hypothetical protein [Clostridium beijerinckii]